MFYKRFCLGPFIFFVKIIKVFLDLYLLFLLPLQYQIKTQKHSK